MFNFSSTCFKNGFWSCANSTSLQVIYRIPGFEAHFDALPSGTLCQKINRAGAVWHVTACSQPCSITMTHMEAQRGLVASISIVSPSRLYTPLDALLTHTMMYKDAHTSVLICSGAQNLIIIKLHARGERA